MWKRTRNWSLASQLVLLQVVVVVTAVAIEAMAGVYHGPAGGMSWQQRQWLGLVALTETALLVGVAGSLFLADRVRRQTFNMEPVVMARMYQHHDAMLHAVREGLVITDPEGLIVLANDEARRLLGLPPDSESRPLRQLLTGTGGAEWANVAEPVRDEVRMVSDRVLMVNRSPASVDGRPLGLVTTLRDRTELDDALKESKALHELTHQFGNKLQVILQLIESGKYDEAVDECRDYGKPPAHGSDHVLAALLESKLELASRQGIDLRLPETTVRGLQIPGDDVITIAGALLDNAIEAVRGDGAWVELSMFGDRDRSLHLTVCDSGPGICAEPPETVFLAGWTTKRGSGAGHGYGLAAAESAVAGLGGTITAGNDEDAGGAVFHVWIPYAFDAERR